MAKQTCGFVFYDGKWRPFRDYREVERGHHKGRLEVTLKRHYAGQIIPVKRIVDPDQVSRYPGE